MMTKKFFIQNCRQLKEGKVKEEEKEEVGEQKTIQLIVCGLQVYTHFYVTISTQKGHWGCTKIHLKVTHLMRVCEF